MGRLTSLNSGFLKPITIKTVGMKVGPVPGPTAVRVHNSTGDRKPTMPWRHGAIVSYE